MRYNDKEYTQRYLDYGEFPHIHDDIYAISRDLKGENVIGLGCCIGLLSLRLARRNNLVIGVEANEQFLEQCIEASNVKYRHLRISMATLGDFFEIVDKYHIKTIYARRVLPELFETGGMELVLEFVKQCHAHGIERFVCEGRLDRKGSTNLLSNIEKEVKALSGFYSVEKSYKECRILKRKSDEEL